jgi:hypothetical protein
MSEPPAAVAPRRPGMGAGRITALVFGILVGLIALGLLAAGGTFLWADQTQRDSTGYAATGFEPFASSGYAIVSDSFEVDEDVPTWLLSDRVAGKVRIQAEGDDLFLGLGPTDRVREYLDGVEHDVVTNLDFDPFRATYRHEDGGSPPRPPGNEDFWIESASGSGLQTVEWELTRGDWTLVVMNADAGAPVEARISAAAEAPFLIWVAVGLLVAGVIFLVLAGLLLYAALRGRGAEPVPVEAAGRAETALGPYPVAVRGDLDANLSRWLWIVKWLLAIPHYIVLAFLWIAFSVLTIVAFFAILFTGRYPRGIFDFNVGVLRWSWRVLFYSYWALGTDRYPPFTLDRTPDYPADLDVAYPERLSRGLVLVKSWLLAIPHYAVVGIFVGGWAWAPFWDATSHGWGWGGFGGLVGILVFFAAVVLLFTGRYPASIFEFVLGLDRWVWRVAAYVSLMRDEYPPFRYDGGPREPGTALAGAAPEDTAPAEPPAGSTS